MPQKTWVIGEEVLATDFNTYVQNQVVPRFATVAARDAAWPAATAGAGAVCTTTDTGTLWVVVAAAWTAIGTATPWTQVAFTGTWTNFGGGYAAAQYRKVGDVVQLRGLCTGSTAAALGTLPAGFRPAYNVQTIISSAASFVVLTVTASTGALSLTGTIGANVSLEGVQFSTSIT